MRLDEHTPNLHLCRVNDRFLMEAFMHAGFKNKQLVRLNCCRISLQATTLADLVTGNGLKIIPSVFNGEDPLKGQSIYQWPNQGPLPISVWPYGNEH
jgi:hypothetical protein